jgi:hypothetical protein
MHFARTRLRDDTRSDDDTDASELLLATSHSPACRPTLIFESERSNRLVESHRSIGSPDPTGCARGHLTGSPVDETIRTMSVVENACGGGVILRTGSTSLGGVGRCED